MVLSLQLQGLNCLQLAAKNGYIDCLRHLLDNYSIEVDEAEVSTGCTALHLSVSAKCNLQRHFQCMKLLLERGADINKSALTFSYTIVIHLLIYI